MPKINEDQATFNRAAYKIALGEALTKEESVFYTGCFKDINVVVSEAQTFLKRFIEAKSNGYFKGQ